MKPLVHDGGHEILLANWPNTKYVICNDNHNFPVKIPGHPYVPLKRSVLCNCGMEADDNFLWESIAACPRKPSALTMYNTANTIFMNYFDNLIEESEIEKLDMHIFKNWTTEQQVFPIALQTSVFDTKLLQAPKTLKDLVRHHTQKRQLLDKSKNGNNRKSFL